MADIAGLKLIKPTSIANSGGTASIGTNGKVTFSGVTSLSLNGVFSSTYDDYLLLLSGYGSDDDTVYLRLRSAGTDNSASSYASQYILASGTSVTGYRYSPQSYGQLVLLATTQRSACSVHMYGPALAQPTAWRSVTAEGVAGARIYDFANTHSVASAFDGFTVYPNNGHGFTGTLQVFGLSQ